MNLPFRSFAAASLLVFSLVFYFWDHVSSMFTATKTWEQDGDNKRADSIRRYKNLVRVPGIPPEKICDIRDYGAIPNTESKSTQAISAAIDDCSESGGGTVVIPAGHWNTGGIRLASRINLFLEEDAEVSFSTDVRDYLPVVFSRFQGIEFYNFAPLIYVRDAENIAITGQGKLMGNGEFRTAWNGGGEFGSARETLFAMVLKGVLPEERVFGDQMPGLRPSFVQFVNCRNVLLDGFTVENGPFWTIHPVYTDNFIARNLHINTWSGNTDGIVLDSTTNAVIEDSFFSTGDDAIVIKSGLDEDGWRVAKPSENIQIRNVHVTKGNSGVSIGSEMSGGVRNISIENSTFENTRHGFRIKSTQSRGGFIEDVKVENITMDNVSSDVITIDFAYNSALMTSAKKEPSLRNILLRNISGSGVGNSSADSIINIDGLSGAIMENVHFERISFTSTASAVHLKDAKNITLTGIDIQTPNSPIYEFDHGENIQVTQSTCQNGLKPCFQIKGKDTKAIRISETDFAEVPGAVEISERISKEQVRID